MRIVRFYEDTNRSPRTIKRGLTEAEVKEWCNDPETDSYTAKAPRGCGGDEEKIEEWHKQQKHWFDGFEYEEGEK